MTGPLLIFQLNVTLFEEHSLTPKSKEPLSSTYCSLAHHCVIFPSQNLPLLNIFLLLMYCHSFLVECKLHKTNHVNPAPITGPDIQQVFKYLWNGIIWNEGRIETFIVSSAISAIRRHKCNTTLAKSTSISVSLKCGQKMSSLPLY